MNTKHLCFIMLLLLPAGFSQAQPVLTHTKHGLASGLSDQVQAVPYVLPGESGPGKQWDFRSLQATGLPIASFVTVDALGRLVVNEGNGEPAGQVIFHFEPAGNANLYTGFESPGKVVVYDRPVSKLRFPFSFGNNFSEAYTAHGLFVTDTIASRLDGTYSVDADAYGSLILPDGRTFGEALRVKTTDRYLEQICDVTETVIEKYLWYVPEYTFPVFTLVQAVSGYPAATTRDTLQAAYYALVPDPEAAPDDTTTGENTNGQNPADNEEPVITLYPNPATSFIEVHSEVDILQYQLRSIVGLVHKTQRVSKQEKPLRIPLTNTSPGWYILNLETASGWLVRNFVIQ